MLKIFLAMSLACSSLYMMPMMPAKTMSHQGLGLVKRLLSTTQDIQVGGIYKHYKGTCYKVLAIAQDSEDLSIKRVVYQALPGLTENPVWVRPYDMFAENITVEGKQIPRFTKLDSVELINARFHAIIVGSVNQL